MAKFAARIPLGIDPDALRDALLHAGFSHLDAAETVELCSGYEYVLSTTEKRLAGNGVQADALAQALRAIGVDVRFRETPQGASEASRAEPPKAIPP